MGKNSRLQPFLNHRIRVVLHDTRVLRGTLMSFDRHMNLVLADADEHRITKKKGGADPPVELKRPIGLVMIRGGSVISLTAESRGAASASSLP